MFILVAGAFGVAGSVRVVSHFKDLTQRLRFQKGFQYMALFPSRQLFRHIPLCHHRIIPNPVASSILLQINDIQLLSSRTI